MVGRILKANHLILDFLCEKAKCRYCTISFFLFFCSITSNVQNKCHTFILFCVDNICMTCNVDPFFILDIRSLCLLSLFLDQLCQGVIKCTRNFQEPPFSFVDFLYFILFSLTNFCSCITYVLLSLQRNI